MRTLIVVAFLSCWLVGQSHSGGRTVCRYSCLMGEVKLVLPAGSFCPWEIEEPEW